MLNLKIIIKVLEDEILKNAIAPSISSEDLLLKISHLNLRLKKDDKKK